MTMQMTNLYVSVERLAISIFFRSNSQNGTVTNKKAGIIVSGSVYGHGARVFVLYDDIWSSNYDNTRLYHMVFTDDTSIPIVSLWAAAQSFFLQTNFCFDFQ